jgi:beta-lactam-binding protein with PASTA domain
VGLVRVTWGKVTTDRRVAAALLALAALAVVLGWSGRRERGSSRSATIPSVVGERYASARARLEALGVHVVRLDQFSSGPAGAVLSQDTPSGALVHSGEAVALTVSKGAAGNAMPELAGAQVRVATAKLKALQFAVLTFTVVSDAPAGTVVSSFPARGSMLRYGDQARLNVSGGSPVAIGSLRGPAHVPRVTGSSEGRAQARLRAVGLTPDLFYVHSARVAGLVARQTVTASSSARLGTLVGLAVSLGPGGSAETPVPYVVGRTAAFGTNLLRSTGFRVRVVLQHPAARTAARTVLDEQPMGGTKAPAHAVVTIVIAA